MGCGPSYADTETDPNVGLSFSPAQPEAGQSHEPASASWSAGASPLQASG